MWVTKEGEEQNKPKTFWIKNVPGPPSQSENVSVGSGQKRNV